MERVVMSIGSASPSREEVEESFRDSETGGKSVEWSGELGGHKLELAASVINGTLNLTVQVGGEQRLLTVGKVEAPATFEVGFSGSELLSVKLT